ncbi:MAG: acyltransferase family protein [Nocardioides sp.]
MSWSYRPALDGVRCLAVYLVVLFHTGVGVFAGGFVGVDLFFVLSGFLVSTILFQELADTGRLDLAHFYDRRVRRLLPAALLVVLATGAVAVVMLSTIRRAPLVGDAQSALLYVANWRFLFQSNDYFAATEVGVSPFLHFWSLSIEEQFYFFFPLLLIGLAKGERRRPGITVKVLLGLFAVSLAAQVGWAFVDANHAYYGTEARLYQLLAGSLLAIAFRSARRPTFTRRASGIGTVLSAAGLVLVASSWLDVSPSVRGLLATVAAVGLVSSLAGQSGGLPERFFSLPPLVFLGKISYGTYLWHWPVIILLREVVEPGVVARTLLVTVLSTALATASYQMLERPVRSMKLRELFRGPTVMIALTASALVAVLAVPPVLEKDGRPALALSGSGVATGTAKNATGPVPDVDFVAFAEDKGGTEQFCEADDLEPCEVVTGNPGPTVVLAGDSHAQMLEPTMTALAREHGFNLSVSIVTGCPWLRGVTKLANTDGRRTTCANARDELYDRVLEKSGADLVLLAQLSRLPSDPESLNLGRPPGDDRPVTSVRDLLVESTDATLGDIEAAGVRSLILNSIWHPTAELGDPLDCLASARRLEDCRVPVPPRGEIQDSLYLAAAARSEDIFTVDINPIMCPSAPVCDAMLGRIPVWRDAIHYSPAILESRRAQIWEALRDSGAFDGLGPLT